MWIRCNAAGLVLGLMWGVVVPARADDFPAWEWFQEVQLPASRQARYFASRLTPSGFDKAQLDLRDLRLRDDRGQEVPYALRVRHTVDEQISLPAREFNRATLLDRSVELSLDLGEVPGEHNELELATSGSNFRRRVLLEGSDTSKTWSSLLEKAYVMHYQVESRVLERRKLHYPSSRFRYLRVRLFADASNPEDTPKFERVTVRRTIRVPGRYLTLPARLGPREAVRGDGGPGSAWYVDLDAQVPCERLSVEVADGDFVRPFRLQVADPGEPPRFLASGEWRRRAGRERKPLEIAFPEVNARRLRLVVTDHANPALTISGVQYTAAAREVIFSAANELAGPMRLYFGNPQAESPHYDFAANLPAQLEPAPVEVPLGPLERNPVYQPPLKPLTERWPWLVYWVLGAASLVLLAILGVLAREAILQHDATAGRP